MSTPSIRGTNVSFLRLTAAALSVQSLAVAGVCAASVTASVNTLTAAQMVSGNCAAIVTANVAALRTGEQATGTAVMGLTLNVPAPTAGINIGQIVGMLNLQPGTLVTGRAGLTVADAVLDVYGLFKIEVKSATTIDLARPRILAGINSVMQQIWSRADKLNYFNQEILTVVVPNGTASVVLPANIQSVIGPVSANGGGKPLVPISTREGVMNYLDYWFGGQLPTVQPPAFFLDSSQDLTQAGRVSIKLMLPWEVTADYILDVNVVRDVPRFTDADLTIPTPIALPAKYVELLFLPLLREWASNDYLFKNETARPGIATAALAAREALGMLEPAVPVTKKAKAGEATP